MKIKNFYILGLMAFAMAFYSCQNETQVVGIEEDETEKVEPAVSLNMLQHVQGKGKLVAVTNCEIINYNTENATPSGFEYELLCDFCNNNGLELEMMVNENLDSCYQLLDSCKVDIVAVGIGANKDMKRRFLLTNPILMQRSVLVQRLPKDWNKMSTVNEVENQL